MCGDSTPADAGTPAEPLVRLTGRIERQRLYAGSKSDHQGMVLVTAEGHRHVLRLRGGNPFREPALEALEGCTLSLEGLLRENHFLLLTPPARPA